MIYYLDRRRSRALSKANIKHDLRRGSRGDVLPNTHHHKVTSHKHVSSSLKSQRPNTGGDLRYVSRSPKSRSENPDQLRDGRECKDDNSYKV